MDCVRRYRDIAMAVHIRVSQAVHPAFGFHFFHVLHGAVPRQLFDIIATAGVGGGMIATFALRAVGNE